MRGFGLVEAIAHFCTTHDAVGDHWVFA